MLYDNMAVNAAGHLIFAGLDTVSLAERYGTPLYLTDEGKIRENLHVFKNAIANYFPCGSAVYYAGKAFCGVNPKSCFIFARDTLVPFAIQ